MTRSKELWNEIEEKILAEKLINQNQIDLLQPRVLSKKVTIEDWNLAIENTVLKGDDNGE